MGVPAIDSEFDQYAYLAKLSSAISSRRTKPAPRGPTAWATMLTKLPN